MRALAEHPYCKGCLGRSFILSCSSVWQMWLCMKPRYLCLMVVETLYHIHMTSWHWSWGGILAALQ
jgi:hypothetical protein